MGDVQQVVQEILDELVGTVAAHLDDGLSDVDWSTLEVDPEPPMFRAAPLAV